MSAGRPVPTRTQSETDAGMTEWIKDDASLVDTDVVLYVFGIQHHLVEEWPIMSVDVVSFWLKPSGFLRPQPVPERAAHRQSPRRRLPQLSRRWPAPPDLGRQSTMRDGVSLQRLAEEGRLHGTPGSSSKHQAEQNQTSPRISTSPTSKTPAPLP